MDLSLIETLRWEPEIGFVRLERHLVRLAHSADALGMAGAEKAKDALFAALPPSALPGISPTRGEIGWGTVSLNATAASGQRSSVLPISPLVGEMPGRAEGGEPQAPPLRVRLELFFEGRIEIQTAAFIPLAPETTWRLAIAETRLASTDLLLRHKTSRRALYAAARAEFPASEADEVILLNERGEFCEGTITTLFLDDGSGMLKTPPLAAGLLAGVLRAELLESGKAVEAPLRPEDLSRGKILVGNSLRGLVSGTLVAGINAG